MGQVKKAQLVTDRAISGSNLKSHNNVLNEAAATERRHICNCKNKVRIIPGSETEPDVSLVSTTESGIMSPHATPLKSRCCGEGCAEGQCRIQETQI